MAAYKILSDDAPPEMKKSTDEQAIENRIFQCLRCLRTSNSMLIDEIVSPRDEDNMHVEVEDADFVDAAIEEQDERENPDEDASEDMADEKKLRYLAGTLRVLDRLDC